MARGGGQEVARGGGLEVARPGLGGARRIADGNKKVILALKQNNKKRPAGSGTVSNRLMAEDPSLSHEEALALVKRAEKAKKAKAKNKAKPKAKPKAKNKEDPSLKDSLVPASDCSMGSGSSGGSSTYDSQVPDYGSNSSLDKREEKKTRESL